MENHATNYLTYFLLLDPASEFQLGSMRTWDNLKLGHDERGLWVKGFDYAQLESLEVKRIPDKKLFYENEGRLFPVGKYLPEGIVPALNWTPIDRAIPLKKPALNYNYFGLSDQVSIHLKQTDEEMEATAILIDIDDLVYYLETAPAIRSAHLEWVTLTSYQAFIIGTPLLPLNGPTFWKRGRMYYPVGRVLEFLSMEEEILEKLEVDQGSFLVWFEHGEFMQVQRKDFQPVSLASARKNQINTQF